jgi:hypothetical protein
MLFLLSFRAGAQNPTYIEVAGGGKFRFFYNEQYFLVDKDCEFLSRIRISSMTAEKLFTGNFTDQDQNGTILLTGEYTNGKKHGTFKAFYSNGYLKWQGDFRENQPEGIWNFYYPDGTPKRILDYRQGSVYILESWNEKGKQQVKNRNGSFLLKDYQFGYNNTGHEAFLYRGKVREGLPHGNWTIDYAFADGITEELATLTFKEQESSGMTPLRFSESEFFANAENFSGKNCKVDDQMNFSEFLRLQLNKNFDFSTLGEIPASIEATLEVTAKGQPKNILIKTPMEKAAGILLAQEMISVGYWIPSQKDGKVIDDTLTVTLELLRGEDNTLSFGYPHITRTKGK